MRLHHSTKQENRAEIISWPHHMELFHKQGKQKNGVSSSGLLLILDKTPSQKGSFLPLSRYFVKDTAQAAYV